MSAHSLSSASSGSFDAVPDIDRSTALIEVCVSLRPTDLGLMISLSPEVPTDLLLKKALQEKTGNLFRAVMATRKDAPQILSSLCLSSKTAISVVLELLPEPAPLLSYADTLANEQALSKEHIHAFQQVFEQEQEPLRSYYLRNLNEIVQRQRKSQTPQKRSFFSKK
jgi:hypothetical protein